MSLCGRCAMIGGGTIMKRGRPSTSTFSVRFAASGDDGAAKPKKDTGGTAATPTRRARVPPGWVLVPGSKALEGRRGSMTEGWETPWRRPTALQLLDNTGRYDPAVKLMEDGTPSVGMLQLAETYPSAIREALSGDSVLQKADYFNLADTFTVKDLFLHRVHLGHKVGTLNQLMKPYLFGQRMGVCIFDLMQTKEHLFRAMNFLAHIAYRDGIILIISADRRHMAEVDQMAVEVGEYSHCRRWKSGTFLDAKRAFGTEIRYPDCVILTSTLTGLLEQHPAITEICKLMIPIVAVCDSNSNPNLITYPVPGNDDTPSAVSIYLKLFKKAILSGKEARRGQQQAGRSDMYELKQENRQKLNSLIDDASVDSANGGRPSTTAHSAARSERQPQQQTRREPMVRMRKKPKSNFKL